MKLTWTRFAREFTTNEEAISRFLSGTSANASGSILYSPEDEDAKLVFLCNTFPGEGFCI